MSSTIYVTIFACFTHFNHHSAGVAEEIRVTFTWIKEEKEEVEEIVRMFGVAFASGLYGNSHIPNEIIKIVLNGIKPISQGHIFHSMPYFPSSLHRSFTSSFLWQFY